METHDDGIRLDGLTAGPQRRGADEAGLPLNQRGRRNLSVSSGDRESTATSRVSHGSAGHRI